MSVSIKWWRQEFYFLGDAMQSILRQRSFQGTYRHLQGQQASKAKQTSMQLSLFHGFLHSLLSDPKFKATCPLKRQMCHWTAFLNNTKSELQILTIHCFTPWDCRYYNWKNHFPTTDISRTHITPKTFKLVCIKKINSDAKNGSSTFQ